MLNSVRGHRHCYNNCYGTFLSTRGPHIAVNSFRIWQLMVSTIGAHSRWYEKRHSIARSWNTCFSNCAYVDVCFYGAKSTANRAQNYLTQHKITWRSVNQRHVFKKSRNCFPVRRFRNISLMFSTKKRATGCESRSKGRLFGTKFPSYKGRHNNTPHSIWGKHALRREGRKKTCYAQNDRDRARRNAGWIMLRIALQLRFLL